MSTIHTLMTVLASAAGLVGAAAVFAGWLRAATVLLPVSFTVFAAQAAADGDYWASVLLAGAALSVPLVAWQHARVVRRRARAEVAR